MREKLFKIFIGSAMRIRSVHSKTFNCKVKEEKLRLIHPIGLIVVIGMFIYATYNGGVKEMISEMKDAVCFY